VSHLVLAGQGYGDPRVAAKQLRGLAQRGDGWVSKQTVLDAQVLDVEELRRRTPTWLRLSVTNLMLSCHLTPAIPRRGLHDGSGQLSKNSPVAVVLLSAE
jgi:hypothetical protein